MLEKNDPKQLMQWPTLERDTRLLCNRDVTNFYCKDERKDHEKPENETQYAFDSAFRPNQFYNKDTGFYNFKSLCKDMEVEINSVHDDSNNTDDLPASDTTEFATIIHDLNSEWDGTTQPGSSLHFINTKHGKIERSFAIEVLNARPIDSDISTDNLSSEVYTAMYDTPNSEQKKEWQAKHSFESAFKLIKEQAKSNQHSMLKSDVAIKALEDMFKRHKTIGDMPDDKPVILPEKYPSRY